MLDSMDKKQKFIIDSFVNLEEKLNILSSLNKTDLNIELENFMIPIFNIIYDDIFYNVNKSIPNAKGIDLISENKQIGIQVSNNNRRSKITDTINKSEELFLEGKLKRLIVFILTCKKYNDIKSLEKSYFKEKDLLTISNIKNLDNEDIEKIYLYITNFNELNFTSKQIIYNNLIKEYFVETKYYRDVKKKLDNDNVVILMGNAGVGKTITSYKLYQELVNSGYITIRNYSEVRDTKENYVFFKDDFISATNYEGINIREIEEIFNLIDIVKNNQINVKIIINSRVNVYEDFKINGIDINFSKYDVYISKLDNYTIIERLELIKNYLFPNFNKKELLTLLEINKSNPFEDNLDSIIEHKNFNPRILERYVENNEKKENMAQGILESLSEPEKIYEKQYNQISDTAKTILKIIWLNDGVIRQKEIERKVYSILEVDSKKIESEIYILENSFLLIDRTLKNEDFELGFYNPSIADFLNLEFIDDISFMKFIPLVENKIELKKIIKNAKIADFYKIELVEKLESILNVVDLNEIYEEINNDKIKNIKIEKLKSKVKLKEEDLKYLTKEEISSISFDKGFDIYLKEGKISTIAQERINQGNLDILEGISERIKSDFYEDIDSWILYYSEEYKEYKNEISEFPFIDVENIKEKYEENILSIVRKYFTSVEYSKKRLVEMYVTEIKDLTIISTNIEKCIEELKSVANQIQDMLTEDISMLTLDLNMSEIDEGNKEEKLDQIFYSFEESIALKYYEYFLLKKNIKDINMKNIVVEIERDKEELENIEKIIEKLISFLEDINLSTDYVDDNYIKDIIEEYLDGDYDIEEEKEDEYSKKKNELIEEIKKLKD